MKTDIRTVCGNLAFRHPHTCAVS